MTEPGESLPEAEALLHRTGLLLTMARARGDRRAMVSLVTRRDKIAAQVAALRAR